MSILPANLIRLHEAEEELRTKALSVIASDPRLSLHLQTTESVMDMLDVVRQFPTDDEDLKVIQMLGLRIFNAFCSSIKLALSGYSQNSALILRDILETVFLLDYFSRDRAAIARWRAADKKARLKEFMPVRVRDTLDRLDGFTGRKRAAIYEMFSELAAHPSMQSFAMLRPKGMDARNGPFMDSTALEAVLSEMGRLAVQVGEKENRFLPTDWQKGEGIRVAFADVKARWIATFYGETSVGELTAAALKPAPAVP